MKIWQVDCVCGKTVPVAMYQCGLTVSCPHCHAAFHVPSSVDLDNWPSFDDSSGVVASSSGDLIRTDSNAISNRLRKRLRSSQHGLHLIPINSLQQTFLVAAVAISISEGLTESQAMQVLEEILPSLKSTQLRSQTIMMAVKAAQSDAAGMWLKQLLFKPFSSGWLGCVHIFFTVLIGCTAMYLLQQFFFDNAEPPGGRPTRGARWFEYSGAVLIASLYFAYAGRAFFHLFGRTHHES